jgi:hypothetical protein
MKPRIDYLGQAISRGRPANSTPNSDSEACGRQKYEPVPIEDLRTKKKQQDSAGERDTNGDAGLFNDDLDKLPAAGGIQQSRQSVRMICQFSRLPIFKCPTTRPAEGTPRLGFGSSCGTGGFI